MGLGAINQVDEVVDLVIADPAQRLRLLAVPQSLGQLGQEIGNRAADALQVLEVVRVGAGAARILDLLLTSSDLEDVAGKVATRAPKIDLEREGVLARTVLRHPF